MKNNYKALILLIITSLAVLSCSKNFPTLKEAFSLDMNFTNVEYRPIVGRNTYYTDNFNSGQSTLPLSFKLINQRTFDGKEAPELAKLFPVIVWKQRYTGDENSLQEIQAKREIMMKPLWEIGEHSGSLTMWENSNATLIKTYPDSGYYFDVEVNSAGGRRFFRDLKLIPKKEVDYEPFIENADTYPSSMRIIGDSTQNLIATNQVHIWFNRVGEGNSLSFKMLSPDLKPIKLSNFSATKWDELVHGFNKKFNSDSTVVKYDVEYPIPLVKSVTTKYTRNGNAKALFAYDLQRENGLVLRNLLELDFSIYKRGDWEIIIYFTEEAPMFKTK